MKKSGFLVSLGVLVVLLSLNFAINSKFSNFSPLTYVNVALSVSDFIQALNVIAVTLTLLVIAWQVRIANRLAKAQILKDRFEMYWKVTHHPTDQREVDAMRADPEKSYLDINRFNQYYKGDDNRIRNYIEYSKVYEYLAFLHSLNRMGVEDPLGPAWFPNWINDLVRNEEFLDVNKQYESYYPDFARYVEAAIQTRKKLSIQVRK
jgi:hypothetical protein